MNPATGSDRLAREPDRLATGSTGSDPLARGSDRLATGSDPLARGIPLVALGILIDSGANLASLLFKEGSTRSMKVPGLNPNPAAADLQPRSVPSSDGTVDRSGGEPAVGVGQAKDVMRAAGRHVSLRRAFEEGELRVRLARRRLLLELTARTA